MIDVPRHDGPALTLGDAKDAVVSVAHEAADGRARPVDVPPRTAGADGPDPGRASSVANDFL